MQSTDWTPLDPYTHAHAGWQPFTDYRFAAKAQDAPIQQAEIGQALAYYPLAFKQMATGDYQLVALLSLTSALNLYVGPNGQWLAPYVPAYFRATPFRLHPDTQALEIDQAYSGYAAEAHAGHTRLYTAEGQLSDTVGQIRDFLHQLAKNAQTTQSLIQQLTKQQLVVPWSLETKTTQGSEPTVVEGYYRIDEDKLKKLPGIQLSLLAQTGALALAYQQLTSLHRLQDFRTRYAKHQGAAVRVDLDDVFGEVDDELSFDFS